MVPGECVQVPTSGPAEYTIKAFVRCEENPPGSGVEVDCSTADSHEIDITLGGNWPIQDVPNNRTIFRYITGPTVPGTNISGQSYTVFDWPTIPSGGAPSGAQASLAQVWADCAAEIPASRVAWKLNRIANKRRDGIIDIYMPLGTGVDQTCGQVYIKWGGQCDGDTIWVAAGGAPVETSRIFTNCGAGVVTATFDECSGLPKDVSISYNGGDSQDCPLEADPQLCFDLGLSSEECFEGLNLGPRTGGAVICTNPPVFVYGVNAWFCPEPLPPSP